MTDNIIKSGLVSFTDPTAWSAGVPGSSTDAEINDTAIVSSDVSETVNSIGTGSGNALDVTGGIFEAKNGTGPSANNGFISVNGATFEAGGGTIDNAGEIVLGGSNAGLVLPAGSVTLDGGGSVQMTIGGGPNSNTIQSGNFGGSPTLINQDNTISGDGTIGDGLIFVNNGTVETNNSTSTSSGTLAIYGTAGVYVSNPGNFINNDTVRVDDGGTIIFGKDGVTGSIDNEASIDLNGTTGAKTELKIAGDMTITASGSGTILLGGQAAQGADAIVSDGNPATLTLVNQTIKGAGTIGDADLTLDNQSGTIDAAGGQLFLHGPKITNGGTLEALGSGGSLWVQQNVNNTGTIAVANGGTVLLTGAISGSGAIDIGDGGTLELGSLGHTTGNVTFTGGGGDLLIGNQFIDGGVGGDVVGAAPSDMIDFFAVPFSASNHLAWQQNGSTGTLSIVNSSNTTLDSINLAGMFTSSEFLMSVNGQNLGTRITVLNPPSPAGTTADMIMRDGSNGQYEIYDLGSNAIQAAYSLGQVALGSQVVAGVGGFSGSDTADMILRNSNTGALGVYDISNNNVTHSASLGQVGLEWAVSGFADFSGKAGETDMLMQNTSTGAFEIYDISNNQITNAVSFGQVGSPWQVAGFGDFSGKPGETGDMLMRNASTGAFEVYDITDNQNTFAGSMGQVGLEWQVAGFGDFSGNANETDMLMRNSNTGQFEIYDISNNGITNAASMGQVGLEWQVVGFGPLDGVGASDMLIHNTNTGALEVYDIANNQITNAASMGQVGNEWSVAGIAADPSGGAAPASAQLLQAMAAFGSGGASLDTSSALGQPAVQSAASSLFAAASGQPHSV